MSEISETNIAIDIIKKYGFDDLFFLENDEYLTSNSEFIINVKTLIEKIFFNIRIGV